MNPVSKSPTSKLVVVVGWQHTRVVHQSDSPSESALQLLQLLLGRSDMMTMDNYLCRNFTVTYQQTSCFKNAHASTQQKRVISLFFLHLTSAASHYGTLISNMARGAGAVT